MNTGMIRICMLLTGLLFLFVSVVTVAAEDISLIFLMYDEQMPPYVEGPYSPYPEGGEDWEVASIEGFVNTEGDLGSASLASNVSMVGNTLSEYYTESKTEIVGSLNENIGVMGVNQASGNLNNQSNQRVFVLSSGSIGMGLIQLDKAVEMSSNTIYSIGTTKQDLIQDSLHNNIGIIGINQSAGSLNCQSNNVVMVLGGVLSLSDGELTDVRSNNTMMLEETGERMDSIRDSFNGTHAVVQISQSAGDLNIMSNNLGLSFREINLQ